MMLMMQAPLASIISIIEVPFLLLPLLMGRLILVFGFCFWGVNLAMCVFVHWGLTLPFGFCLWGGEPCPLSFAYEGINIACHLAFVYVLTFPARFCLWGAKFGF